MRNLIVFVFVTFIAAQQSSQELDINTRAEIATTWNPDWPTCGHGATTTSTTLVPVTPTLRATTTSPTTTTTTMATIPTTMATTRPVPTTTSSRSTTGPSETAHVGTYIFKKSVYNQVYMGIGKLNVQTGVPTTMENSDMYSYWGLYLRGFASKLTHLYYSGWEVDENCNVEEDDFDASWYGHDEPSTWIVPHGRCLGLMNDVMSLKSEFPHLNLMLVVHGKHMKTCSATTVGRHRMIDSFNSLIAQIDSNMGRNEGLWSGIAIDAEDLTTTNDWENHLEFIRDIKEEATKNSRHEFQITSSLIGDSSVSVLSKYPSLASAYCNLADTVHLVAYGFTKSSAGCTTGHGSPFCTVAGGSDSLPTETSSVQDMVQSILDAGCQAKNIVLGLPMHAETWTNVPAGPYGDGLFQTAITSVSGDRSWIGWSTFSNSLDSYSQTGEVSFWDMKFTLIKEADLKLHTYSCPENAHVVVPIKYVYSSEKDIFGSFDDIETIGSKVMWAKNKGLGGFLMSNAQDDRYGELLTAATAMWGSPEVPATQAPVCFDERKPNKTECKLEGRQLTVNQNYSCGVLKLLTNAYCGQQTAAALGAYRSSEDGCIQICSSSFGSVNLHTPEMGDVLYYQCN